MMVTLPGVIVRVTPTLDKQSPTLIHRYQQLNIARVSRGKLAS